MLFIHWFIHPFVQQVLLENHFPQALFWVLNLCREPDLKPIPDSWPSALSNRPFTSYPPLSEPSPRLYIREAVSSPGSTFLSEPRQVIPCSICEQVRGTERDLTATSVFFLHNILQEMVVLSLPAPLPLQKPKG